MRGPSQFGVDKTKGASVTFAPASARSSRNSAPRATCSPSPTSPALGADYGGVLNIGNYSVGALAAGNIALATMLSIPNAGEWLPLQTTLDGISPRVLPLIAVLTTWWMINKKQFSPTKVIIVFSVVVAIACLLGVF